LSVVTALQHFDPAPYAIARRVAQPEDVQLLASRIENLQRRLVAENPDVQRWLVTQVIIPVALGDEPRPGACTEIWGEAPSGPDGKKLNEPWTLMAENLLCLQQIGGRYDLQKLIALLPKQEWRLPASERLALAAIKHTVEEFKLDAPEDRTGVLLAQCAMVGRSSQQILGLVHEFLREPSGKLKTDLLHTIARVRANDLNALDALIKRWNHDRRGLSLSPHSEGSPLEGRVKVEFSDIAVEERALPFDLFHLEMALSALASNLERNQRSVVGRKPPSRALECLASSERLELTYLDNSTGFTGMEDLANAVKSSLEKKDPLFRGLPLALSFPFHYAMIDVAVMMANRTWQPLVGPPSADMKEAENTWTFGVRWSFNLTSQSQT
jgi:hypothetical protein